MLDERDLRWTAADRTREMRRRAPRGYRYLYMLVQRERGQEVLYIGQTRRSLRERLMEHQHAREVHRLSWRIISLGLVRACNADRVERRMIRTYHPVMNRAWRARTTTPCTATTTSCACSWTLAREEAARADAE